MNHRPECGRRTRKGVTTAAGVGRDSFVTEVGLTQLGRQASCDGWNGEHFRLVVEVTPSGNESQRLAEQGEGIALKG